MENKIEIKFLKENTTIDIDIQQPDLAGLVRKIIAKHLDVSMENMKMSSTNEQFDTDEFSKLLIEVHEEYRCEIDSFFENIEREIRTYYNDEELSKHIISRIKNIYVEENNS